MQSCQSFFHWPSRAAWISSNSFDQQCLDLGSDNEALIQWSESHGSRQAKSELYSTIVRTLQREGNPVNNVLLLGHRGTGKSMMSICATRLANWIFFRVTQDVMLQAYQGRSKKSVDQESFTAAVGLMRTRIVAAIFRNASECQSACITIDQPDYLLAHCSPKQSKAAS